MDARHIASTMAAYREPARPASGLKSTVPRVIYTGIGDPDARHVTFVKTGKFYKVLFSKRPTDGSVMMSKIRGLQSFPRWLSSEMRLGDGDQLDWHLGAAPGRRIDVLIKKGPSARNPARRSSRASGRLESRPLVSTKVSRRSGRHAANVQSSIPRACFMMLGEYEPEYVAWHESGGRFRVLPCGADHEDARRVSIPTNTDGYASYALHLPQPARDVLALGAGSRAMWYAATDGRGHWEVQVGPLAV